LETLVTRRKIRTTILSLATALVIAAVAAPLASAATVPPDSALGHTLTTAPETQIWGMTTPSFTIFGTSRTTSSVYVQGLVFTTPDGVQAAQGLIDQGYRFQIRVWGDDSVYDDLLLGPITPRMLPMWDGSFERPGGLGYVLEAPVSNSVLDEDDSILDDHDEIYAGIRLLDPSGQTIRSKETKRIGGYW